MDSRREKIGLLSRINRGKTATPAFMASLSEALECALQGESIQSLTETDSLWGIYGIGYSEAVKGASCSYRHMFSRDEAVKVFQMADCLARSLSGEKAFLLSKQSEICGAVEVEAANLLKHCGPVINLDGDAVRIVSKDKSQGLMIDFNPDDVQWQYEVAAWGDRWPLLVLACNHE